MAPHASVKPPGLGLRRAVYGVFAACLAGDTHPDTNAALTAAAQQPGLQAVAAIKTYFDADTQAGKGIQALQQPLQNLSGRCRLRSPCRRSCSSCRPRQTAPPFPPVCPRRPAPAVQ